jgi:hypothetical protein
MWADQLGGTNPQQTLRPSEFDRYLKIAEGKAVSLRNELDALRTLMLDLRAMLDSFPTSVQQDSELLRREGGLGRRLAFAAAYRRR